MTKDKVVLIVDDCSALSRNIVKRLAAMDCGDVVIMNHPMTGLKRGNHRYPIRTKLHGFHNKGRTSRI